MNLFDLLRSDGSIVVNKSLAHEIGLNEAVIYSELVSLNEYWRKNGRLTDGEWFFCTIENLEKNTTLKKDVQSRALKKLLNLELIESKRMGLPAKRYFKITNKIYDLILKEALSNQIAGNEKTRVRELSNTDESKPDTNNTNLNYTNLITNKYNTPAHENLTPEQIEQRRELARYNWLADIEVNSHG